MQGDKFISYKNANLFYRTIGQGKAVVLLHGFGEDGDIWKGMTEYLKKQFQVIVPDIPGSGKSDLLKDKITAIDDYAEAVKYILEAEKINVCAIIGHSMGGYIALAFAEKYPERLNSFGLFHSSAFADDDDKIQTRLKAISSIKDDGAPAYLKTFLPGLFTENFNKEHNDVVESLIKNVINFTAEALIQYHEAMIRRPDRSNILKQFSKPVLFIAGEKDKAVPLNNSLKQSHLPSICHFHVLPNSAHMGLLEEKDQSENLAHNFLINL